MYNKLFTKILDSSIWLESMTTRLVWLTFIAAMDENGYVQFASAPNVALRARVPLKAAEQAIACLEGPDPNSSDPDHDGRRIEKVPGGWMVLNAEKYRDLVTRAISQAQTRARVAKHRERRRNAPVTQSGVTCNAPVTQSEADTDTEARSDADGGAKNTPPAPMRQGPMGNRQSLINGRDQRRHGEHASPAACAIGLCVHASLDSDFSRRLAVTGGKGPDGRILSEWYRAEVDAITASGQVPGEDVFDFWRNRFAAWVGTVSTKPATGKDTSTVRLAKVGAEYLRGEGITARPERPMGPARPMRQIARGE